ncbi:Protein NifZ [Frankia canadensis]|uniref:Protein NifZ n=1 Tax=Frankia canadensis TaxID=1836972 RepID=A0A2I2KYP1_9ACTN|nr:nitrogen fixation protein NifZ [Frankia canadensis]SNQ50784.1 Protein NifZ [Frankia canadensis]SOU58074.1 Protein NifZ [Frankia canadensis]
MSSNTYDVGDVVATVKDLRNDGTYPDPAFAVGEVLVEAGTIGEVINVGLYLQEHIVYAVAFRNGRVVGALERELAVPVIDADAIEARDEPIPATASAPAEAAAKAATPAKGEAATPAPGDQPVAVPIAAVSADGPGQGHGHGGGHGEGHGGGKGHGGGGCKHGSSNCGSGKGSGAAGDAAKEDTTAVAAEAAASKGGA